MTAQFPEGEGIFETIKTDRGLPFALGRHIARAKKSASILGLKFPSESKIRESVATLMLKRPATMEHGRLRITFHATGEYHLLHENFHPWESPARLTLLEESIDESSPTVGMKTLPFTENIRCLRLAHIAGFDDGIRFNTKGEVCETSVSNLLLRIKGRWVTSNLASGALPGITRGLVLEWLNVSEDVITYADLEHVEAIYLLCSLKQAQPVSFLEGRSLEIDPSIQEELSEKMARDLEP
jgi:branched-chain amino acid aminotransferase